MLGRDTGDDLRLAWIAEAETESGMGADLDTPARTSRRAEAKRMTRKEYRNPIAVFGVPDTNSRRDGHPDAIQGGNHGPVSTLVHGATVRRRGFAGRSLRAGIRAYKCPPNCPMAQAAERELP